MSKNSKVNKVSEYMKANEVREKYLKFFESSPRDHKVIEPGPLVLADDPTTLFTSSGMQPLVSYLLGEKHPEGSRLVNSQPSIRLQDIEEVGDNRHTTFFEMLGNWSLGDYFKEDQLPWIWEFLTKQLELPAERLWITVFEGNKQVPKDTESVEIWKKIGVPKSKIFYYDVKKNWWSRTGTPNQMPIGDIGGPTSEIFYEFTGVKHDKAYGKECHPNCDCGRFLEIGNSVFMQYKKVSKDDLEELPNKNIDFGGGFERLVAVTRDDPDIFNIDLFSSLIEEIEKDTGKKYEDQNQPPMRVIADHVRAAAFLISDNVTPSNKEHGYILRRLIRRSAVKVRQLKGSVDKSVYGKLVDKVIESYENLYLSKADSEKIKNVIKDEVVKFRSALNRGLKEVEKVDKITAKKAFNLYQSYGFPLEITEELFQEKGQEIDRAVFKKEFEKHKEKSRTASAGKFRGGLLDHSPETIRLHTATHLLQASLRKVLGAHVIQQGQNITVKRSRFDFRHDNKLTDDELEKVEQLINEKVKEEIPVNKKVLPKKRAEQTGAIHAFGEKYGDKVNVYFVGKDLDTAFSKEFCGGPHVANTREIGRVKIKTQEKIGSGVVRIYMVLD